MVCLHICIILSYCHKYVLTKCFCTLFIGFHIWKCYSIYLQKSKEKAQKKKEKSRLKINIDNYVVFSSSNGILVRSKVCLRNCAMKGCHILLKLYLGCHSKSLISLILTLNTKNGRKGLLISDKSCLAHIDEECILENISEYSESVFCILLSHASLKVSKYVTCKNENFYIHNEYYAFVELLFLCGYGSNPRSVETCQPAIYSVMALEPIHAEIYRLGSQYMHSVAW